MEKNRKQWGTMSIYDTLNDRQREAVFKTKGPVLILAGAGSGKTTVLVNRIANLIAFGEGADSDEIPDYILSGAKLTQVRIPHAERAAMAMDLLDKEIHQQWTTRVKIYAQPDILLRQSL